MLNKKTTKLLEFLGKKKKKGSFHNNNNKINAEIPKNRYVEFKIGPSLLNYYMCFFYSYYYLFIVETARLKLVCVK